METAMEQEKQCNIGMINLVGISGYDECISLSG
jgi:hypothetical protein